MKNKKHLLRLATVSAVFALGVTLINIPKQAPTEVQATPYTGDYDPYTYDGNYYNSINFNAEGGMYGSLRTSLTSLIKPAGFYTYGSSGETHLSTQLQYADEDPNNNQNMIYLYTRDSVKKNAASTWNREHVWCQSLSNGNWGQTEGGTDILHLRPTYNSVNSSRGNTPYGDSGHKTKKTYNGMDFGYTGNGYFEPLDCVKGDVARIVMYLWVTYTGYKNYSPLNITSVFQSFNIMLQWHTLDKPDVLEGNRNDYAQTSKQKNRNPFVDHPELAWKIFGNESTVSESVRNACMAAYPVDGGDPIDPTGIKLNKSTAEVSTGKTLQLRATLEPTGATGNVSWSSSNTSVATVNNSGLVTAKAVGNTTITATCGSYSASCVVTVNEATNDYGTLENPLSIADAIEVISQTGASLTPEPLYVKGVVSSNEAYTSFDNYGPIWLKSDDGSVEQAFELYRAKLHSSITGDYSAADSLKNKEVVAYGYGKYYNNSTYELCNADTSPTNPTIMSISAPEATGVTLNRTSVEIIEGGTATLVATLTPSDSTSPCTWESSDETVATVDNGVVTGVSAGTATITVTVSDDITAECTVTVIENGGGQGQSNALFIADLTDTMSVDTTGYSITSGNVSKKTGYYQDGSDVGSDCYFKVTKTSALFGSQPSEINFTAYLGAGAAKDPLTNNVYACFVDVNGNDIVATRTVVTSSVTTSSTEYSIELPYNANAYGVKLSHEKVSGHNVRFYSFSLSYVANTTQAIPTDYLENASSISTIYGNETTTGTTSTTESVTFSQLGYDNGDDVTYVDIGDVSLECSKGTGSTPTRYYSSGSAIRFYGGNTLTFTASSNITGIQLTITAGSSTSLEASTGALSGDVWTGSATEVVLSNKDSSGHLKIATISVTYGDGTVTVDSVALRFGATIPQTDWNTLDSKWGIDDYGVMLVREATLENTYHKDSVEEAFKDPNNLALANIHRGSGAAPTADGANYLFTVKINNLSESDYNTVYCAAPYIVVNGTYYFLTEMRESVRSLAAKCTTSNLSAAALALLVGD